MRCSGVRPEAERADIALGHCVGDDTGASALTLALGRKFVATSNPFHSLLSPTTRRSILLIRSERSASAALIAAIVCCKVPTFDPSDTIPPSAIAEHRIHDEAAARANRDSAGVNLHSPGAFSI